MAELRKKVKEIVPAPTDVWKAYLKKTKGMKQMTRAEFDAAYPKTKVNKPRYESARTKHVSGQLRKSLSAKEVKRLKGK